ncbi:ATP-grasp domain-containing protein [Dictyobacter arantiisoli]|uniref:Phosphoribosylglycinamide synthetase n=1 Tax=Dictyobacter arantiisoli TaxID=2014874 RepID=A0A5A5TGU5_9CHLR|nr:ATP-grasp domain-containing protein [Dictyobacter arantiisoli]GCF10801.1 phosphoribosylglycinamide synthetase [Dictyobacter arantiisoli]
MNKTMGIENKEKSILLLMTPATYRAGAFLQAAQRLHLEVVVGLNLPEALADYWHVPLGLDFADTTKSVQMIVDYAHEHPFAAILSVDDSATELAAYANAALGLANNSPQASEAARDKLLMRQLMSSGGAPCPIFRSFWLHDDPDWIATQISYPCVVKPRRLSGSRGVIRANDPAEFIVAFERLKRLLLADGASEHETSVLVEDFIPGFEVALEGLLTAGKLQVLTLFDKPDPLDGPFFEETIYVTPSRLSATLQQAIADCVSRAALSLGLRTGPVHAELRVNEQGPWMLEIAGRSIGGLCSTVLEFGSGMCLEELILRHAIGEEVSSVQREEQAAGVMMIPIPGAGILKGVHGIEAAEVVPLITGVEISAQLNNKLVPLPEGSSYLGFIFARGANPPDVEAAIRQAHSCLRFDIRREIPLLKVSVNR